MTVLAEHKKQLKNYMIYFPEPAILLRNVVRKYVFAHPHNNTVYNFGFGVN